MKALLRVALLAAMVAPAAAGRAQAPEDTEQARRIVGAPRAQPLAGPALEAAAQELASVLRCPVCQGLSIADSPTGLARNMKAQARALLAAGYDREQVLAYFESSYGEFVRLKPPLRGINWLVWVAPMAGLLVGGLVVARSLRTIGAPGGAAAPVAPPVDDPALLPYLLRVREMAYGWPGGRPPDAPLEPAEKA